MGLYSDEFEETERRRLLIQPIAFHQFMILLLLAFFLYFFFFFSAGSILTYGLGLNPIIAGWIVWLSLLGSSVNIPVKEIVSERPIVRLREFSFFGFRWIIPDIVIRQRTIVAVNLGGAVIPSLLSLYLLTFRIPLNEPSPLVTYFKILFVTAVVATVVNRLSKLIPGLGIAVPSFIPPLTTALTTILVYNLYLFSNPYIIAYVSGTLGTLIGADLLNFPKISRIGSAFVSIGGAGTFDGIYMTGLVSMFMVFLLL